MKRIPLVSLRVVRERSVPYETRDIGDSRAIYGLFRELVQDLDREAMWIACLDAKKRAICLSQVSLGTLDSSPAHPREILKIALAANAHSMILVHNHPSGDPQPSPEDRRITASLREASRILGIRLLDHLIVGDGSYYSFADAGGL